MPKKTSPAAEQLIGKKATYRKVYQSGEETSEVVSVNVLYSFPMGSVLRLTLANGDTVDADNCYFSEPIAATA